MKKETISVLSALTGVIIGAAVGAGAITKMIGESEGKTKALADKHLALYLMMNQWVRIKQEGKNLASYFEKNGYKKIAIYGMSYAGETLMNEVKDSGIEIAYGIDRNSDSIYVDVDVLSIEDVLDKVDVVVVTAITFFDEIEEKLSTKLDCPIVSLEEILYEM